MKYLIITADGALAQLEDVNSKLLKQVESGEIAIARFNRDGFEYLVAGSRAVDDPGNSFDEVRQDQAIDGWIYEVSNWEPMEIYDVNTGETRRADAGRPTLIDDERVKREFEAGTAETYEERRDRVLAEEKEKREGAK